MPHQQDDDDDDGRRKIPFFRSSGFPSLTVAITISPTQAAGRRFKRPLYPLTAITYKFLAPVLSAQLIQAPVGRPRDMRNFPPAGPPRPDHIRKCDSGLH
jgi:hypothetical protein